MEGKAERLFPARTSTSLLNPLIPGVCPIHRQLVLPKFRNMPLPRDNADWAFIVPSDPKWATILGISTSRSGVIGSPCCSLPRLSARPVLF
jgi:hypothetical protein